MKDTDKDSEKSAKKEKQKFRQLLVKSLQEDEEVQQAVYALMLAPWQKQLQQTGDKKNQDKIKELRQQLDEMQEQLQTARQEAKANADCLHDLQEEKYKAQKKQNILQEEKDALADELDERFPEGWRLYRAYEGLDEYLRKQLHGVVHRTGFSAFIVGISQETALGNIWDAWHDAVLHGGAEQDIQFLQQLFQYSLQLINLNGSADVFCLEVPKIGSQYDFNLQELAPDSRAQGEIQEVLLPGYRNQYQGRLLRKSLVRV